MLYIRYSELIHLIIENVYTLKSLEKYQPLPISPSQPLATTFYPLFPWAYLFFKKNKCYFKPLSFGVVYYVALGKQNKDIFIYFKYIYSILSMLV